jgi:putative DNA primase/helicase
MIRCFSMKLVKPKCIKQQQPDRCATDRAELELFMKCFETSLTDPTETTFEITADFAPIGDMPDDVQVELQLSTAHINVLSIPAALRALPQWVLWRYVMRNFKQAKAPFQPNGLHAKSNDPGTWATFDAVLAAYRRGRFDGIGIVFGGELVGVDLDGCFNGDRTLTPWADDLLCDDGGLAIPTYTELSPSGNGLHLLYFGKLPDDLRGKRFDYAPHVGAEFYGYPSNRYFTVTGQRWGRVETVTTIDPIDFAPVAYYIRETLPRKPQAQRARPQLAQPTRREDDDILLTIGRARNAEKALALLTGNMTGYPSASEADAALCAILAHYTPSAQQIDRLFRRSGLFRADKWDARHFADGRTYGQATIESALALGGAR